MRAFDVVCKDFELRLGIDHRVFGKQQVAIGLPGIGFLGVLPHENFAVENAARIVIEDAMVKFMAFATGLDVIHQRVVVHQLFSARHVKPVQQAIRALAAQRGMDMVAGDARADGDRMRQPVAVRSLRRMKGCNVKRILALVLDFAVLNSSARFQR